MTHKKRIALWSSVLAIILVGAGAVGISSNDQHNVTPAITASPYVELEYEEPDVITADPEGNLSPEPEPEVGTIPAPVPAPIDPPTIPYKRPLSTTPTGPVYKAPITAPVLPLPAPQRPPVAPSVPLPQPVLPPTVVKPVEGLVGPLKPIIDPLIPPILDPIIDPLLK